MTEASASMDVGANAPCGSAPHGALRAALLVVDDEPAVADALAFMLSGEGYTVATAADAEQAALALRGRRFDAVLTDLTMPGGGRRWLAELRAVYPHTTVIVITALDTQAACYARSTYLADALLAKPAEPGVLLSLLANILPSARG
jgi:DNA-binding response OmpR family regulator